MIVMNHNLFLRNLWQKQNSETLELKCFDLYNIIKVMKVIENKAIKINENILVALIENDNGRVGPHVINDNDAIAIIINKFFMLLYKKK